MFNQSTEDIFEKSVELSEIVELWNFRKIWFTSDEHYGSTRAIQLSQRLQFMPNNTSKMNSHFIKCHNERVSQKDLVIHLGDFGMFEYIPFLNGKHILVKGNYETDNNDFDKELLKPGVQSKLLGKDSIQNNLYLNGDTIKQIFSDELSEKIEALYLTHKPEDCILPNAIINVIDDDYKPYKSGVINSKYIMNLFGHIHEKAKIKPYGLNVGVDCHHYCPLSTNDVEFYLLAILKYYDKNVFM